MSFRDQLTNIKNDAANPVTIIENLKQTLLEAAQNGDSSVVIPMSDKSSLKFRTITNFLDSQRIRYENEYDKRLVKKWGYMDPHESGFAEAAAAGKETWEYTDTEYTFKGIRVFI